MCCICMYVYSCLYVYSALTIFANNYEAIMFGRVVEIYGNLGPCSSSQINWHGIAACALPDTFSSGTGLLATLSICSALTKFSKSLHSFSKVLSAP